MGDPRLPPFAASLAAGGQNPQTRPSQSSRSEPSQHPQSSQVSPPTSTAPPGLLNPAIDASSASVSPTPSHYYTPLNSPPPSPQQRVSTSAPFSPTPLHALPRSSNDHGGPGRRMEAGENVAERPQDRSNLSSFPVHRREDLGTGACHPAHPTGEGEKWTFVSLDPRLQQEPATVKKPKTHHSQNTVGSGSNMEYPVHASGSSSSLPAPGFNHLPSPLPPPIPRASGTSSSHPPSGFNHLPSPLPPPIPNSAYNPSSQPSFTSSMVGYPAGLQNREKTTWPGGNAETSAPTLDQRVAQLPNILEGVSLQGPSTRGDAGIHVQPPFHYNLIELLNILRKKGVRIRCSPGRYVLSLLLLAKYHRSRSNQFRDKYSKQHRLRKGSKLALER